MFYVHHQFVDVGINVMGHKRERVCRSTGASGGGGGCCGAERSEDVRLYLIYHKFTTSSNIDSFVTQTVLIQIQSLRNSL